MNVSSDPCVRGVDPKIECSHCKEVKEKLPNICTYHSSFHLYPILTFFQEGHTNRSCKLLKAQNPHDLTRDDYEFWSYVNVHALPAHDRNENDSDDDDHDDDDDDEDDDDDDDDGDSGDDDNDEGPLDLFCGETFPPPQ